MNDLIIRNHGSVCILVAITPAGQEWIDEHIDPEAMRWGSGIVVEPRYVEDIANGAANDGLSVGA
jgi:hypothetical protein